MLYVVAGLAQHQYMFRAAGREEAGTLCDVAATMGNAARSEA